MDSPGDDNAAAALGSADVLKRIRKGTKSCVECRHRKIRCVWTSPQDSICVGCKARGRHCVPQLYRRATNAPKLSSKDRISRLEQQLADIAAHSHHDSHRPSPDETTSPDEHEMQVEDASSESDHLVSLTEGPASNPPTHIRFLFDNALIDPHQEEDEVYLEHARCSKRYLDQARLRLQRLLPSREDLVAIAGYATPWMSVYMALFPSTAPFANKDELVSHYDEIIAGEVHPVSVGLFLITFAVTALQVPANGPKLSSETWKDLSSYAREVAHTVESTIILHTGLAITVEGIETTIMYLRLQLSLGSARNLWLTLRRTIALSELTGLPRAWYTKNKYPQSQVRSPESTFSVPRDRDTQKAALWAAVCATDRMSSMIFNLPAATATHHFPREKIVSPEGEVLPRPYIFQLASIAMSVHEIDEAYALDTPLEEVYEKVLAADRCLRSLKSATPPEWWSEHLQSLSPGLLIQYWHYYLTARMHLHSAMKDDQFDFAYSRLACTEACESMCRRYLPLRRLLPPGFFLCRIADMQVFTAAAYLLLSAMRPNAATTASGEKAAIDQRHLEYVQQVVEMMEASSEQVSAESIREATAALRALMSLLKDPASSALHLGSQNLTLRIPLLGKVRLGRQAAASVPLGPGQQQYHAEHAAAAASIEPHHQHHQHHRLPNHPFEKNLSHPGRGEHIPATVPHPQNPNPATYPPDLSVQPWPWLMQLDMNASSMQDPFFTGDDMGGFNVWSEFNAPQEAGTFSTPLAWQ